MPVENINVKELSDMINQDQVVLVDCREVDEFEDCHIPGAINLPLSEFSAKSLDSIDLGNKKVVIYCRLGKRSLMAAEKLSIDVYSLVGGIEAWQQAAE